MSSDPKIVGYCRACGKALDEASVRTAYGTIYCPEHAGSGSAGSTGTGDAPPNPASASASEASSPYTSSPYSSAPPNPGSPYAGTMPPPIPNTNASPSLAFLLGLIPGVGAIYNGQYAKGLVHVVVIGLMISILDNNSAGGLEPLIGMALTGFWFYMAFDSYHTAKRRQMGLPVDDFSGLVGMGAGRRLPIGPVVLIALGIIFLLQNLGLLELRRFLRYWPVLLIILGVHMLYRRIWGEEVRHGRR